MSYRQELVSPKGRTVVATSPTETNNLVYAHGYKIKKEDKSEPKAAPQRAPKPVAKPEFGDNSK